MHVIFYEEGKDTKPFDSVLNPFLLLQYCFISFPYKIIKMKNFSRAQTLGIAVVLTISLCTINVGCKPIDGKSKASAFYYLTNYGYIHASKSENTAQLLTEDVLTKAIRDFQVHYYFFLENRLIFTYI